MFSWSVCRVKIYGIRNVHWSWILIENKKNWWLKSVLPKVIRAQKRTFYFQAKTDSVLNFRMPLNSNHHHHHHGPSRRCRRWARRFSIFFCVACGWQWKTKTQRHAICCDRQQVFPMTVERCGSPPCHAWWRLCSAVWVCQFYEARYRIRCRGYLWAGDHLPYGGRGLAAALW